MLIAVISDTHMPRPGRLPEACLERLAAADLILHAGDLVQPSVLDDLEAIGPPVSAIIGNVDVPELWERLPARRVVEAAGVRIGMVHDAGRAVGRLERMRAAFPTEHAVIFGHSHMPLHERAADGFQIFNPGSPTERRRAPSHTMGLAHVGNGAVEFELVTL